MDYQIYKLTKWNYVIVLILMLIWIGIYFWDISIDNKPLFISIFLTFLALIVMAGIKVYDEIREGKLRAQLRKELIKEIKDNLKTLEINVDSIKNAEKERRLVYNGLYDQIFNSLVLSNRILIFTEEEREHIFNIYRGVRAINYNITNILSQPPEFEKGLTDHRVVNYRQNLITVKARINTFLTDYKETKAQNKEGEDDYPENKPDTVWF